MWHICLAWLQLSRRSHASQPIATMRCFIDLVYWWTCLHRSQGEDQWRGSHKRPFIWKRSYVWIITYVPFDISSLSWITSSLADRAPGLFIWKRSYVWIMTYVPFDISSLSWITSSPADRVPVPEGGYFYNTILTHPLFVFILTASYSYVHVYMWLAAPRGVAPVN